jgi:hypothetical protein
MTQSKILIGKTAFLSCVFLNSVVAFLMIGVPTQIQPKVAEQKKNGVPIGYPIQVRR